MDAARADPVSSRGQVELGEAVLAHTHRFVHALLTVDAVRDPAGCSAELTDACRAVLVSCRDRGAGRHGAQQGAAGAPDPGALLRIGPAPADTALVDASDRIANSLDTLVAELRRQADDLISSIMTVPDPCCRPRLFVALPRTTGLALSRTADAWSRPSSAPDAKSSRYVTSLVEIPMRRRRAACG